MHSFDKLSGKKILITGGAGFIGSHIAETLLKNGIRVRIVDNLSTGNHATNVAPLLSKFPELLEFVYGDLCNMDLCYKIVDGVDVITHQAALGSVPRSVSDPMSSHKNNVIGFFNILCAAKEKGIKRFVYASSSSVYGDNQTLPKIEHNTGNVLSPYAATKFIDEIYAGVFAKCYEMECIGLRYFNIFGPRQDPNGQYAAVIPKFITQMNNGERPTINGDGSFSRDFTFVSNAVLGNILALTTDNNNAFGQAFNIGAEGQYTILDLVNAINSSLGTNIEPIFAPNRPGDIPHSNASVDKARNILGYNPIVVFNDGIKDTVHFFTR